MTDIAPEAAASDVDAPLTVADLELPPAPETAKTAQPANTVPVLVQKVEPTRNGQPWVDWPDAEAMLVEAAQTRIRCIDALNPTAYRLDRDEKAMTLTLVLV